MKNRIFKHLEKAKHGYLRINTPCGNEIDIGDKNSKIHADMKINDWNLIDLILSKGDIGFGEGYIKGLFSTESIENLLLLISLNQKELAPLFHSNILYSAFFGLKNLFRKTWTTVKFRVKLNSYKEFV